MAVSVKEIKQLVETKPNFKAGHKSQVRLEELGFDPLQELVQLYRKLQDEDTLMCALRDGVYVPLNEYANPIRYSYVAHTNLLSQLEKVASQLMRYGYSRVSETVIIEEKPVDPLIINLDRDLITDAEIVEEDQ